MKVLIYSARPYDKEALIRYNEGRHELFFTEKKLTKDTASLSKGCDAIALFTSDDASKDVIVTLAALGVKFIALRSVGYDHVDLKQAEASGIEVANVPAYSPYSVAEHGVALLMAANRKIIEAQRLMDLQDYRLDPLVGFDIHGKTVGVIGTGNIGIAFAKIMTGFGAKVIAVDPIKNPEAISLGVEYVSFETLLCESDIISIHCPLNSNTRYLFSEKQFGMMKESAVLINTSRGPIINTKDLLSNLRKGKLKAVCLDVYEKEKGLFFNDHRGEIINDEDFKELRSMKNVIITGHQGFLTNEALQGIAETTLQNLDSWENETQSPNSLTKEKVRL